MKKKFLILALSLSMLISGKSIYANDVNKYALPEGYQFLESSFKFNGDSFSEGLSRVIDLETKKYGYIDETGKLVIPYQFNSIDKFGSFREGLVAVADGESYYTTQKYENVTIHGSYTNKYGYIDKSGNLVIPYQFVDAKNFMDGGMAIVGQHINESYNVFYGVIDKEGNMILPTKFNLNDGPSQSWGKLPGDIKDGIVSLKDPDTGKTIYISKSNDIETGNYIFYPRNGQQEEKIEISGFIDLKDLFKMSTIPNKEGHIFIGWFIGETKSSTLPGRENSKDYDTSFRENIVGLNGDSKFYAAYVNKDILDIEVDPNVNNYYEYSELYLNKDELEDFRYNEEARNLMFLLNTCKPLSSNYDKNVLATSDIDIFENNKFLLETYDIDKNNKLSKRDYYKMLDNKNDDYFEDKENNK